MVDTTAPASKGYAGAKARELIAASLLREFVDISANYTLKKSDLGKVIRVLANSPVISPPTVAATPLPAGWWCDIQNAGSGTPTLLTGGGITWKRTAASLAPNEWCTVVHDDAADNWSAVGGLT